LATACGRYSDKAAARYWVPKDTPGVTVVRALPVFYWHDTVDRDPANSWLRTLVVENFAA
jgi:hypothetical protein